jgi:hypothetical protein
MGAGAMPSATAVARARASAADVGASERRSASGAGSRISAGVWRPAEHGQYVQDEAQGGISEASENTVAPGGGGSVVGTNRVGGGPSAWPRASRALEGPCQTSIPERPVVNAEGGISAPVRGRVDAGRGREVGASSDASSSSGACGHRRRARQARSLSTPPPSSTKSSHTPSRRIFGDSKLFCPKPALTLGSALRRAAIEVKAGTRCCAVIGRIATDSCSEAFLLPRRRSSSLSSSSSSSSHSDCPATSDLASPSMFSQNPSRLAEFQAVILAGHGSAFVPLSTICSWPARARTSSPRASILLSDERPLLTCRPLTTRPCLALANDQPLPADWQGQPLQGSPSDRQRADDLGRPQLGRAGRHSRSVVLSSSHACVARLDQLCAIPLCSVLRRYGVHRSAHKSTQG